MGAVVVVAVVAQLMRMLMLVVVVGMQMMIMVVVGQRQSPIREGGSRDGSGSCTGSPGECTA